MGYVSPVPAPSSFVSTVRLDIARDNCRIWVCAIEYTLLIDPYYHGQWFPLNSPIRALPSFAIGIILAQGYGRLPIPNGIWLGVAAFACAIVAMVLQANTYIELALFVVAIWLTAAGYANGDQSIFDRFHLFRELGNCSYSVYMLHVIFLVVFVQKIWPHLSSGIIPIWYGCAIAVFTTLVSIACYHLYEKRMRGWITNRMIVRPALAG
jgi:peptidoglycan/LPS O-acetylase OafA/YrhL